MMSAGWSAWHRGGRALGRLRRDQLLPPVIAPGRPGVGAGAFPPSRRSTITCFTVGEADTASSAVRFIGTTAARR